MMHVCFWKVFHPSIPANLLMEGCHRLDGQTYLRIPKIPFSFLQKKQKTSIVRKDVASLNSHARIVSKLYERSVKKSHKKTYGAGATKKYVGKDFMCRNLTCSLAPNTR